jgi:hypothetical protein
MIASPQINANIQLPGITIPQQEGTFLTKPTVQAHGYRPCVFTLIYLRSLADKYFIFIEKRGK